MADPKQDTKIDPKAEAAKSEKKADAAPKAAAAKVESGGVRVKSKVNMLAKDGTRMVAGEMCTLSDGEYQRLKADKRHAEKPFFEEA